MYILIPRNADAFLGDEIYKLSEFYGGFVYKPKFVHPLQNPFITQLFGENKNKLFYSSSGHDGIDYRCAVGTNVYPVINSIVTNVKEDKSYGKVIVTSHNVFMYNGKLVQYIITYCHLSDTLETKKETKLNVEKRLHYLETLAIQQRHICILDVILQNLEN